MPSVGGVITVYDNQEETHRCKDNAYSANKTVHAIEASEGDTQRTKAITFDVVDINYPYNAIFGRNTLVKFVTVIHQSYLCMKLPLAGGVVTVFGNQEEARRCGDNASSANKTVHAIETPKEDNSEDTQSGQNQKGCHQQST